MSKDVLVPYRTNKGKKYLNIIPYRTYSDSMGLNRTNLEKQELLKALIFFKIHKKIRSKNDLVKIKILIISIT